MGTSQSSPGPGGKSPLVPPWADDQPESLLPAPMHARFKPFRTAMGRFVSEGGAEHLNSSLQHYARKASGGSSNAARRMGAVTKAGGGLFDILTGAGSQASVESSFDINSLAGLPRDAAISAISEALSSEHGDADKVRAALNHALVEALDGVETFDPSNITDVVIVDTMIGYLAESIFLQIVMDSKKAWNKATTPVQMLRAENELRELIKVVVDKHMRLKIGSDVKSYTKSEIVQIERSVIVDVWRDWESYK